MKRIAPTVLGFLGLMLSTTLAVAHEEMRMIGTVTLVNGPDFEVTTKEGVVGKFHINGATEITRDKAKVEASAIKVGTYVVADGFGDDSSDLLALDVKLVPPPAK